MADGNSSSLKSVLLLFITPLVTGVIGYGLRYIFEPQPKRVFSVSQSISENIIRIDDDLIPGIVSEYKLKNSPTINLKSFFLYSFSITNSGTEGVDDFELFVTTNNSKAQLISGPKIETNPMDLRSSIKLHVDSLVSDSMSAKWKVPLLNPGEALKFTYSIYSDSLIEKLLPSAIPRKKNWQLDSGESKASARSESFLNKPVGNFMGEDLMLIVFIFTASIFSFYLYSKLLFENKLFKRLINWPLKIHEKQISIDRDYRKGLHLLIAKYGSSLIKKDVTEIIGASISGDKLDILVHNEVLGGDPHEFNPKTLSIQFLKDGEYHQIEKPEGERVIIH